MTYFTSSDFIDADSIGWKTKSFLSKGYRSFCGRFNIDKQDMQIFGIGLAASLSAILYIHVDSYMDYYYPERTPSVPNDPSFSSSLTPPLPISIPESKGVSNELAMDLLLLDVTTDDETGFVDYIVSDIPGYSSYAVSTLSEDAYFVSNIDPEPYGFVPHKVSDTVFSVVNSANTLTGVDPGFMLALASRESGIRHYESASNSSASGLFQFTNVTWGIAFKQFADRFGFGNLAEKITINSQGYPIYDDVETRQKVLGYRNDPFISAYIVGYTIEDYSDHLDTYFSYRTRSNTDIYLVHFLGKTGSREFLNQLEQNPNGLPSSRSILRPAVNSNYNVFHENGRALTFQQVYTNIKNDIENKTNYYSALIDDYNEAMNYNEDSSNKLDM